MKHIKHAHGFDVYAGREDGQLKTQATFAGATIAEGAYGSVGGETKILGQLTANQEAWVRQTIEKEVTQFRAH